MNNLFARVYGGLLISVIVVGCLCFALFRGINTVRYEHHNVALSTPLLNYISTSIPSENHSLLFNIILPAGSHLGVVPIESLEISSRYRDRLDWGQVVVTQDEMGSHIFKMLGDAVLVGYFPDLYSNVSE